jgi:XapX domain-containing protein
MNAYMLSLAAGLAVGLFYSLVGVRSPAPPAIALLGLLGILLGEQMVPLAKRLLNAEPLTVTQLRPDLDAPVPRGDSVGRERAAETTNR